MCLYFPSSSPCCSWEQTIVICSAKHQRHAISFGGSYLGHSHERRRLSWSECDSQGAGLKMRCKSLGSTHQGACKCLEKQKTLFKDRDGVSSKGPSQWVPPTLQPVNSTSPETMSEGVITHFSHHDRRGLFQFTEECGSGLWVSSKFIALSSFSPAPHNLVGVQWVWLTELSHVTFWKC